MIAVLTTPGRPEYLADTIASLERAGAAEHALRVIFVDGDGGRMENLPFFSGWLTESLGAEPQGTRGALAGVLHAAARFGEDLLFFEDDIRASRNAVRALELLEVPADCGFLVACDIAQHGGTTPQIVRRGGEGPKRWGSQAMKIPARALEYMASRTLDGSSWPHAADIALGQALAAPPAPWAHYGIVAPSLFNHIGERSSVTPEKKVTKLEGRASLNYIGDDADALPLARVIAGLERQPRPLAQVSVISVAGREELTADTCRGVMDTGVRELGIVPRLFHTAPRGRAAPDMPPGFEIERGEMGNRIDSQALAKRFRTGTPSQAWFDFMRVVKWWDGRSDVLFLEDDLAFCKNAVRKMIELEVPEDVGVVSFFDYRNQWPRPGLWRDPPDQELHGSQAFKFPARMVPRLQGLAAAETRNVCWDVWVGQAVSKLGLSVAHYAPSLVQHVGMASVYAPGVERPMADNFPGEDFDALGPCPDPIPKPTRAPVIKDHFCELHQMYHAQHERCPLPG